MISSIVPLFSKTSSRLIYSERFFSRRKVAGYIRESPSSVNAGNQAKELIQAGCKIFFEEISNVQPEFTKLNMLESSLKKLKKGDLLTITSLDRLGLSLNEVIYNLKKFHAKGIRIKSLDGTIDTDQLGEYGIFICEFINAFKKIDAVYKLEKRYQDSKRRELTGLKSGGRPRINKEKEELVLRLRREGFSYRSIRNQTGLALSTIRRVIIE